MYGCQIIYEKGVLGCNCSFKRTWPSTNARILNLASCKLTLSALYYALRGFSRVNSVVPSCHHKVTFDKSALISRGLDSFIKS